ncbi:MAG: hypothetical protein BM556_08915 [Bacteriovorax sp. MedPE-SWde]|nr:MAG: hypothetical protein BM556_08915 [Bacteriovorax sp. MedPE-SWde]
MNNKKSKILIVTDHYFPSENAGGPLISIKNLVLNFKDKFDFSIYTRNHDVNSSETLKDIEFDKWVKYESTDVFYASHFHLVEIRKMVKNFDDIYLNSFFSPLTISFLLATVFLRKKLIIAPRGEFSPRALKLKSFKKNCYIKFFKHFLNKTNVIFQSTSPEETSNILSIFPKQNVYVAQNIPDFPEYGSLNQAGSECLKLIHHSRIVPKKNLLYFLELLNLINIQRKVEFLIYGNIEDQAYWKQCQREIEQIENPLLSVVYLGALKSSDKFECLSKSHVGVQPTLGENFGHSIFECFASNLHVVVGIDTPWQDLNSNEVGINLTLDKVSDSKKLEDYIETFEINNKNKKAYNYALKKYKTILKTSNYNELFSSVESQKTF